MSSRLTRERTVCTLAAACFALAPASTAAARDGVYGGATRAGDPIVLTSDAKGQKLTGAVFRIRVDGQDEWWPLAGTVKVRPAPKDPKLLPTNVLVAARNAGGRFDSSLLTVLATGPDRVLMAGVTLKGSLTTARAKGTLSGWVAATDAATQQPTGFWETGTVKWTAERSAGRIYGGATADALPIVIKLDRRAANVSDLWLSYGMDQSTPPGSSWSASDGFSDFPLTKGRFGDAFSNPIRESDGTTTTYAWSIAGRVTPTAATGTVALNISGTQPTGEAFGFAMPATKFTAKSG
jgi:hypothetical protein